MRTMTSACALITMLCAQTVLAQQADDSPRAPTVESGTETPGASAPRRRPQRANVATQRSQRQQQARQREIARFVRQYDKNNDQQLDKTELPEAVMSHLEELDTDKNGKLNASELMGVRGRLSPTGEIITGPARGERYDDSLQVGDRAPDFTLPDQAGKREVTLSSFKGKRPVVLIFGSYT